MDLRERVFAALNAAKENGHDMMEDDPGLIAADMINCSDRFENLSYEEQVDLQNYIIEWQESFLT